MNICKACITVQRAVIPLWQCNLSPNINIICNVPMFSQNKFRLDIPGVHQGITSGESNNHQHKNQPEITKLSNNEYKFFNVPILLLLGFM